MQRVEHNELKQVAFIVIVDAYLEVRKQDELLTANPAGEQSDELARCREGLLTAELGVSRVTAMLMAPQYLVSLNEKLNINQAH